MGYTHYWTIASGASQANYSKALKVCQEIVKAKQTILETNEIGFNGIDDQAHEDFCLPKEIRAGFEFCKTARKAYDIAVVACLIALKRELGGDIAVKTDGVLTNWLDGLELFNQVTKGNVEIQVIDGIVTLK
jgi:hypothetical protein